MKHKPSTLPDFTNVTEADLLQNVADILTQSGPFTLEQREVLDAINAEFIRRDSLSLRGSRALKEIPVSG